MIRLALADLATGKLFFLQKQQTCFVLRASIMFDDNGRQVAVATIAAILRDRE